MSAQARRWVAQIPVSRAGLEASLRCHDGVELARDAETIWVRGPLGEDDELPQELAAIPFDSLLEEGENGLLHDLGGSIPCSRLPTNLTWSTLHAASMPASNLAGLPGETDDARAELKLVPSSEVLPTSRILASMRDLLAWVETAPEIRFRSLSFACSEEGMVVLAGSPLPFIPGTHLVAHDQILMPAGWTWSPALPAQVLRGTLGLHSDDQALLLPDAPWQWIEASSFQPVTRASVRRTSQALNAASHE